MSKYLPQNFEAEIAEKWTREKTYRTPEINENNKQNKVYALSMFPYPSGEGLHVGHVRIYTGTDVLARLFRMQGKKVLHPMGWDAFGLPAENAAIKIKKNPMDMVPENIAAFKKQMQLLGLSYDWDKELNTTDPEYYKWTQWLFIQFYKKGLLYKKDTPINFCPKCKTGLAEEEVLANGTHERCGSTIEKRELPQWIFKITEYADRLLADIKLLDWPEGIATMQKNWIGKKEGININYKVKDTDVIITCFTTRPDTNFGATFIVLAPEHKFVKNLLQKQLSSNHKVIEKYVKLSTSKSGLERQAEGRKKTGVFTGFYAVNNLNDKLLPIWISDFVLPGFGTGAVVGVPAHDLRDFEFAKEFDLEIVRVVVGKDGDDSKVTSKEQVQEEEGKMINSGFLNGLDIHEAMTKVMDYLEEKKWGKRSISYHLRDWIFSRQRYWGEPIPMIFCKKCGWQPVSEEELPLKLPYVKSYEPTGTGESPLLSITSFRNTKCPKCEGEAVRETDTMPNWAGSCWYFLRFAFDEKVGESTKILPPSIKNWKLLTKNFKDVLPVDWYLGGAEHAVLHLLYSRFWVKALQDLGLLNFSEPFLKLRNVGMLQAEDGHKMSKSLGNVINPNDIVKEYGADALRLYEMFMAPFNYEIAWSTKALQGTYRFLNRIWNIYTSDKFITENKESGNKELVSKLNKTIVKVGSDLANLKFNTAIAALMEFLNTWEASKQALVKEDAQKFLKILAPLAPFVTEKLWQEVFKEKTSVHLVAWPKVDIGKIVQGIYSIPVQVNGKMRALLKTENIAKDVLVKKALADVKVNKYLEGKKYKTIYVKGKILNFVLAK